MPVDLLAGPLPPRRYRGKDWVWLCWDGMVTVGSVAGLASASLSTSLDGGGSVVPLSALGDRPITNLRLAQPAEDNLRLQGELLASGQAQPRYSRILALDVVEHWAQPGGTMAVESSSSEMLFRCDQPPTGAAWRLYFQKRWLAIQHLAVARPGQIELAENLLAGGLEGGAAPQLDTLGAAYSVRAARGYFSTVQGQVKYRGVQLGPLMYDMTLAVEPAGITLNLTREVTADCLAFDAPVLRFLLANPAGAARQGDTLRLAGQGAVAVLQAQPPLRWQLSDGVAQLLLDDFDNDLGLKFIQAGRRQGTVRITFQETVSGAQ